MQKHALALLLIPLSMMGMEDKTFYEKPMRKQVIYLAWKKICDSKEAIACTVLGIGYAILTRQPVDTTSVVTDSLWSGVHNPGGAKSRFVKSLPTVLSVTAATIGTAGGVAVASQTYDLACDIQTAKQNKEKLEKEKKETAEKALAHQKVMEELSANGRVMKDFFQSEFFRTFPHNH
jgi:hypothetical protein